MSQNSELTIKQQKVIDSLFEWEKKGICNCTGDRIVEGIPIIINADILVYTVHVKCGRPLWRVLSK